MNIPFTPAPTPAKPRCRRALVVIAFTREDRQVAPKIGGLGDATVGLVMKESEAKARLRALEPIIAGREVTLEVVDWE